MFNAISGGNDNTPAIKFPGLKIINAVDNESCAIGRAYSPANVTAGFSHSNVFATACRSCVLNNPHLERLSPALKGIPRFFIALILE